MVTRQEIHAPKREQIRVALEQQGLRFAPDWEYHDGKIYTFIPDAVKYQPDFG